MSQTLPLAAPVVPPEEVERRIAEYRRLSWERRLPPQVVYHEPQQVCPWPGCGLRIVGIRFQLENMGQPALMERWLSAWWQGPGLLGRCPRCGHDVLFDVQLKKAVSESAQVNVPPLPDDWYQRAHLIPQPMPGP